MPHSAQVSNTFQLVQLQCDDTWRTVAYSFFTYFEAIAAALGEADSDCVESLVNQAKQRNPESLKEFRDRISRNARLGDLRDISTMLHGNCAGWCTLIDAKVNKQKPVHFYYGQDSDDHTVAWTQDAVLIDSLERRAVDLSDGSWDKMRTRDKYGQALQLKNIKRKTKYESLHDSLILVSTSLTWIIMFRTVINGRYGFDGRITWRLDKPAIELSEPRDERGQKVFSVTKFRFSDHPNKNKTLDKKVCRAILQSFVVKHEFRARQWKEASRPFWKVWNSLFEMYGIAEVEQRFSTS